MRKTVLPITLLLGLSQASANKVQEGSLSKVRDVDAHLNEQFYNLQKITDYDKQEITDFWINKVNGQECTNLFNQIIEKYNLLDEAIDEINDLVDDYNQNCNDKCLPGFVKCGGDASNKCIPECECCSNHNKYCCKDSSNHPVDTTNYATGDGEVLYCYDWCCSEDATYCGGECIPDAAGMPVGYGGSSGSDGPKVCCEGQDCCDDGQTYLEHLTTTDPFCCILDEVINKAQHEETGAPALCCCENDYDICCPNH